MITGRPFALAPSATVAEIITSKPDLTAVYSEDWKNKQLIASRSWLAKLLRRRLLLFPLAVIVEPLVIATPPIVRPPPSCAPVGAEVILTVVVAATVPLAPEPTATTKPFGPGPVSNCFDSNCLLSRPPS